MIVLVVHMRMYRRLGAEAPAARVKSAQIMGHNNIHNYNHSNNNRKKMGLASYGIQNKLVKPESGWK